MSPPDAPTTLSARLAAMAQRMGLLGSSPGQIAERASQLQLPFSSLPGVTQSIVWNSGPPFQRLNDLPRSALSGPVQEDKADAHAILIKLVEARQEELPRVDLRSIYGIASGHGAIAAHADLESYASSEACRQIRIISYKDFVKALSQPLPKFLDHHSLNLYQGSWRGERLFWGGEQHADWFASAVVYARLRGLEVSLPAQLSRYRISDTGLRALDTRYYALAMPSAAWSNADFMQLLMNHQIPYARLSVLRTPGSAEFLLLPKHSPQASALGEGLSQAGAPNMLDYVRSCMPGARQVL